MSAIIGVPLVRANETLHISDQLLRANSRGYFGTTFLAHVISDATGDKREVAAKVFHESQVPIRHLQGYNKYFKKIPWLQKKYSLLYFNKQQLVPQEKIENGKHAFVLVSEIRHNLNLAHPEVDFSKVKLDQVKQLEKFVTELYKDGMLVAADSIELTPLSATSPFHNIEIRDPDIMAGALSTEMRVKQGSKFKPFYWKDYRSHLIRTLGAIQYLYSKCGSRNDLRQFKKRSEKFLSDMQIQESDVFDLRPENETALLVRAWRKLAKKNSPGVKAELRLERQRHVRQ